MSKKNEENEEMFSIKCLLDNFSEAFIEIPAKEWDEAYKELEQKIKSEDFFDVEVYGGSIEISGVYVNALNCKKVIGLNY